MVSEGSSGEGQKGWTTARQNEGQKGNEQGTQSDERIGDGEAKYMIDRTSFGQETRGAI